MASPDFDSPWSASAVESFGGSFNIHIEEGHSAYNLDSLEITASPACNNRDIPKPPPLPSKVRAKTNSSVRIAECCRVPKETRDTWDKLFKAGYEADVYIITEDEAIIPAHFSILVSESYFLYPF